MKYAVITFGCRVNQADSLGFEEELRAAGGIAAPTAEADVVVVNTCSVTATADQGGRQTIRRIARDNPRAQIVVTGCYATRRPDEVRALPNVLRVIPNDDKPRLIPILRDDIRRGARFEPAITTADRFGDGEGSCGAAIVPGVAGRTAFTLRVQTGCDEPCAYCIIPATRGRPRSVPLESVVAEVGRVASAGFKEIALTGVHLGSYGRDLTPASSLIDLLHALDTRARESTLERSACGPSEWGWGPTSCKEVFSEREPSAKSAGGGAPALERMSGPASLRNDVLFRISSLEPMECGREIIDLVAEAGCFAPHFHLPLQHASDRVLARMRRPYTLAQYRSLVDDIRFRMPHASIGSDIIVGFPDETGEDFDQLTSYLDESPLTHVHVFPYSDRPGTAASVMRGKVAGVLVRERGARVRDIGHRLTTRFHQSQVGTVRPGLTIEDGSLVVTDNYLKVRVPPGTVRNERVMVKITEAGETMRGEIL